MTRGDRSRAGRAARLLRALGRRYDRAAGASPWRRLERQLKARLGRRRRHGPMSLARAELLRLGEWKTPRIRRHLARNTAAGVRGLTAAAFLVRDEGRRVRVLVGLRGVGLAVASVLLHFADPTRYPVYDVRVRAALRRLGVRRRFPPTPAGWVAYLRCLQALARRFRVSLRTLDKALWVLGGAGAAPRRRRTPASREGAGGREAGNGGDPLALHRAALRAILRSEGPPAAAGGAGREKEDARARRRPVRVLRPRRTSERGPDRPHRPEDPLHRRRG